MKKYLFVFAFLLMAGMAHATGCPQLGPPNVFAPLNNNNVFCGNNVFTNATFDASLDLATIPFKMGTLAARPASCVAGSTYFPTDVATTLYICNPANIWNTISGGGGGSPGPPLTTVQFNDSGTFAGDINLTWNKTTHTLNTLQFLGTGAIAAGDGTTGFGFGCADMTLSSPLSACLGTGAKAGVANTASQAITFRSRDSGNVARVGALTQDSTGFLLWTPDAGSSNRWFQAPALVIDGATGGGLSCTDGSLPLFGSSNRCVSMGTVAAGNNVQSQEVHFHARNAGGATVDSDIFEDAPGNINIASSVGGAKVPQVTFAGLPTTVCGTNNCIVWCSDCNASCTAGSSTGRTCFRENGAWVPGGISGVISIANTPLTTTGDLLTVTAGNLARLGIGANGTTLTSNGTSASWITPAGTGTVTHTPGALTANFNVVGNGGADVQTMDQATNKYYDVPSIAAPPANPSAGNFRYFGITGTGLSGCLTSSGANCLPSGPPLGTATQIPIMNAGATAYAPQTLTQDCSISATGVITCTKTNNVAFAASATTDTTNATNISSGTLNTARLPAVANVATGFQIGGAAASANYLRGNGTNFVSSAIQVADVPTLNQNTSGTAANLSGFPTLPGSAGGSSTKAATQNLGDSTTAIATDQFVLQNALTNPMTTTGDIIYGVGAAATRLAGPTAPATTFTLSETPSGGLATAPFWNISGVTGRIVSGNSDTILGSDRSTKIWYCNNGGSAGPPCATSTAVAVTLPQAGTGSGTAADFSSNYDFSFVAGPGMVTITPTTSLINGNATLTAQQQSCFVHSTDNANWLAACFDNNSTHPAPLDTGSANAYVVTCPGVAAPLQRGDTCTFVPGNANTTPSTINVSGLGVKALTRVGGASVVSGDILASPAIYGIVYDGTEWEVLNPSGSTSGIISGTQADSSYYADASHLGSNPNPLISLPYTGSDRAVAINSALNACTNSVCGDSVDARGELSFNSGNGIVVSHSMFPQNSTQTANNGFQALLPSGKFVTSVPQKVETQSAIITGTGRGSTSGKGATMIQASTVGAGWSTGIGTAVTITCPGGWGGDGVTPDSNNVVYAIGHCINGFAVSGGTGWYYNVVVVFTDGGNVCSTNHPPQSPQVPSQVLQIVDGVPVGIKDIPQGVGSDSTARGAGCASLPTYVVYPGPPNPNGTGTLNGRNGTGPAMSPYVLGVGNPSDAYTEDTQISNMALDCGPSGTPATLGSGDMNSGLSLWGSQESGWIFGVKVTGCGIADFDIGGGSQQTQNGPILVGTEVLSPTAQCPNPNPGAPASGTYQGTPWSGTGSVGPLTISNIKATQPVSGVGVVTVTLSGNITQITQGQSIEISGIANGTNGTIFSTSSDSTGTPLSNPEVHSYYEVTSPTCVNCNTFQYQVNSTATGGGNDCPTGSSGATCSTGTGAYSAGIITPWPVSMRTDSTAITPGIWHSTIVGCFGNYPTNTLTSQRVVESINGMGGLYMAQHAEKGLTGMAIGDQNFSQGQTLLNQQNTTLEQTSYLISNQFPVTDLLILNSGAAKTGSGGMPATLLDDLPSGNVLTSAQQSWIPFYLKDNSGGTTGNVTVVDPSTSNSNIYQNGINFFNGVEGFYSGSTTPNATINAAGQVDLQNVGQLNLEATTSDASYTVGKAACVTATNTVGNCATVAATEQGMIGVLVAKNGSLPKWAKEGTVIANSNASLTFTAGHTVCNDATNAGFFVDNGTTSCTSPQIPAGVVKTTNTGTTHTIVLNMSAAGGGGGGGSGTVNSGTAGQVAWYPSTAAAVSGQTNMNISNGDLVLGVANTTVGSVAFANATSGTVKIAPPTGALGSPTLTLPITTGTLFESAGTNTGAAGAVFDFSAQTTAPSVKLPNAIGGTILAGTSINNLSAPIVVQNTNSSNNNTSITMGISSPGSSAGQTTLNVNGASTGADLLDIGTGGIWTAGVLSGQTLVYTFGQKATGFTYPAASTTGFTLAGTTPASVAAATGTNATSLLNVQGVAGGACTNAACTGGIGSSPTIGSGTGGSVAGASGNAVGGAGGNINITAAAGANSINSGANSNGGNVVITPGAAGTGGGGAVGKAGVLQVAGPNAGFVGFQQGAANTTSNTQIPANTIIEQAPTSVTAYSITKPSAAANGIVSWANSSGVVTESIVDKGSFTTSMTAAATPSGTVFLSLGGSGASYAAISNGTETLAQTVMPQAGTFHNLYAHVSSANGAGQTLALTVSKNAVASGITCTIGNSVSTCNDTAHTLAFVAGDLITIKAVDAGTSTSAALTVAVSYY